MAISQFRSKRKVSSGRYRRSRKKKLRELGGEPTLTKIGKTKVKKFRIRGDNLKFKTLSSDVINIYDPKTKKTTKVKVKTVLENPANRHFVRRNILTKGTVVETEKGKAKITNRPGQEGTINAILVG